MTEVSRSSAQIYQFPPRGRFAVGGTESAFSAQAANLAQRFSIATVSGAWYHDEAVRESEQSPPRRN